LEHEQEVFNERESIRVVSERDNGAKASSII
jgi:hypothetical protein